MSQEALMQLEQLHVGYQTRSQPVVLIKDINLEIRKGELVCLLGQNGVGKSTLLRTLAGVQPPLSGKIRLKGELLGSYSIQILATQLSLVLTEKISAGNLLVEELVALGRHPYTNWLGLLSGEDKHKVDKAISQTRINYLVGKKVGELSDGQYQKAMIARALAQDGELMILDEPTAFLDLNNSVEIFLLLRRLAHESGKGIVVSTHDFHLAMEFADKLWLTNFNSPLYEGLPEDLALNGLLEESMYHEGFGLDMLSGRIIIDKQEQQRIDVMGPEPALEWTVRALEKNGFSRAINGVSETKIVIEKREGIFAWINDDHTFTTIESLIQFLRKS